MIISFALFLGALSGIYSTIKPDSHMIYFGQKFDGVLFKMYYAGIAALHFFLP
jgi:hypothetical protein